MLQPLSGCNLAIDANPLHQKRVLGHVEGMQAIIFVDDEEPFDPLEIPDGFENGGIGLRQWGDHGLYDDVVISGPGIPPSPGESVVEPNSKLASSWGIIKTR